LIFIQIRFFILELSGARSQVSGRESVESPTRQISLITYYC